MYSEDRPSTPDEVKSESEQIPTLQRRTIHPDSLQFMDMAQDLLNTPQVKQAIKSEQQKAKDGN